MHKVIIVQHSFSVTTPKTQRMIALAKELKKRGWEVVLIISSIENISSYHEGIRVIKISSKGRLFIKEYHSFYIEIKKEYDDNSIILFYEVPLYSFLFRKSKYHVFAEITEIPFYGHKPSIIQRLLNSIRLYSLKRFSGLQVISDSLKRYYMDLGVQNVEVINMFVDANRFSGIYKNSCKKYIAYCGRISLYKDGVDTLIRAFSIFVGVHSDYNLKIIGAFESYDVENQLKQLILELGLSKQIEFTGVVSPESLPQLLKNAEILALARPRNPQAEYGFPTKLGEYLATGNVVVVTKVGNIPDFLTDNKDVLFALPNDVQSFAERIIWAASNPEKAQIIGANGKKIAMTAFSVESQTSKVISFYSQCFS